jgi:hypothetical protein
MTSTKYIGMDVHKESTLTFRCRLFSRASRVGAGACISYLPGFVSSLACYTLPTAY